MSIVTRPLRYPNNYPERNAEEKGIDVALAVDFVMGAAKGSFRVGIVVSLDTDLRPAIETVLSDLHGVRAEVAAFNNPGPALFTIVSARDEALVPLDPAFGIRGYKGRS